MKSLIGPPIGKDVERKEEGHPLVSLDQNEDDNGEAKARRTIDERFRETLPSVYARRGLLWLSVSIFFQAAQIITMTKLSKKMGVSEVFFFRSWFLVMTIVGVSWKKSESYHISDIFLITMSAFFDVIFIFCTTMAGQFIWVGDVTSISLNSQVPSALLACILLGEALDIFDGFLVVLNAIGVVFVCQPSFLFPNPQQVAGISETSFWGYLLALASLAGSVGNVLLYRALVYRKTEDAFLLTTLAGMIGLLFSSCSAAIMPSRELPESPEEWFTSVLVGIFTLLTFIPIAKSIETENLKTITVMLTIVIPLTTSYDLIVLGRDRNWGKIGGVLLILGSSFALHLKTTWNSS